MKSLRNLTRITFFVTAFLLGILIITGVLQNNLMGNFNAIIKESEGTVFLYSTIREQATEGILFRNPTSLLNAAEEFEKLYTRQVSMLENQLIPSQYKLSFLQNLDLEQVVINLKNLADNPGNEALVRKTIDQLRQINKKFLQFDRIIISEMRNRIMQDQKRALVIMGLIVALTCFTLILLYQKSIRPLLKITALLKKASKNDELPSLEEETNWSVEIRDLTSSLDTFLRLHQENVSSLPTDPQKNPEFSAIINEVTNGLNGIINYSQLLADYFEAENIGDEQRQILGKIITTGEKSAAILQKKLLG